MTTKTSLLAKTITPQVRDYIDAAIQEAAGTHAKERAILQQTNTVNHNALLKEMSIIKANLATVNGIIANDPTHRLTKAKLIKIATELGL